MLVLFILLFVAQPAIKDGSEVCPIDKTSKQEKCDTPKILLPIASVGCQANNPKTDKVDEGKDPEAKMIEVTEKLYYATLAMGIATFLLALFALWQVFVSRNSSRKQLRAYVGIETVAPQGKAESVRFEIKNFGKTPALNVTCWCKPNLVFPEGIDLRTVAPPYGQTERGFAVIEPDALVHFAIYKEDVTPEQHAAMISGKIFFYGRIGYRDVFAKLHWRTFCYFTEAQPSEVSGKIHITFPYYEFGNESDDSRAQSGKEKNSLLEWLKAPF